MVRRFIQDQFIDHPASVDETYFEHLRFASGTGLALIRAGLAAICHGLLPRCCETTASTAILNMAAGMRDRFPEHPASQPRIGDGQTVG